MVFSLLQNRTRQALRNCTEEALLCVSPGAVNTDFVAGRDLAQLEKLAQATPLKRVVEPDDVARAIMACVLYLKTSTGVKIVCDGGRFLV